jgi:hypothetical protein
VSLEPQPDPVRPGQFDRPTLVLEYDHAHLPFTPNYLGARGAACPANQGPMLRMAGDRGCDFALPL